MPSLAELNERQKEAAMHIDGPCMVVAAAGSGKTAMLIARIQYLIDKKVEPRRILACTFTKKAAKEMEERLVKLVGAKGKQVTIGTIHAVGRRMLANQLPLSDENGWKVAKDPSWLIEMVLEEPSTYNRHGVGPIMMAPDAITGVAKAKADALSPEQTKAPLRDVYAAYETVKAERKWVDFEDMLLLSTRLMKTNPAFAAKWQHEWDYVLVDEFQDTNTAQWQFLLELTKQNENLFVVGDDWQSVYGFRGARPQLMTTHFMKQFPHARRVLLTINYRSHDLIVDLGNRVIELNDGFQIKKTVEASREISNQAIAQIATVKTDVEEAEFVAQEISRLHDRYPTIPWNEYAVLYRTNIQSRVYEEALDDRDIPYHVVGDSHFYESRDVKAILDYLRTTIDQSNPSTWAYLLNRPKRYIPREAVQEVAAGGWGVLLRYPRCDGFVRTIHDLAHHHLPADAIQWLVDTQKGLIRAQDEEEPIRWVDSLIQAAMRFRTVPDFLRYVDRIVERSKEPKKDAVQLSTIHRSKGLEYLTVFVVGMVEGLLPHKNSLEGESLREETRLCYVGLTRAKENLYLLAAKRYGSKELPLSRYLTALSR